LATTGLRSVPREPRAPAAGLRISKYDALGNTYLIVDPRQGIAPSLLEVVDGNPTLKLSVVKALCDDANGIGSNGLLFGPALSDSAGRFDVRIVNSDGTFAGFSGNGTRIFARYLLDAGDVRAGASFQIEVQDGSAGQNIVSAKIDSGAPPLIGITAPYAPRFGPAAVAANLEVVRDNRDESGSCTVLPLAEVGTRVTAIRDAWTNSTLADIGNPHCVTFVKDRALLPTYKQLKEADAALRMISFRPSSGNTSAFAAGINLQWAWPEGRDRLHLVIYERGEGPTPASGSSASAAACAAYARGLAESRVNVVMPGGTLAIRVGGSPESIESVTLSGTASRLFETTVDEEALAKMLGGS
jgi:diaminopimelate epimerase